MGAKRFVAMTIRVRMPPARATSAGRSPWNAKSSCRFASASFTVGPAPE
jgi:hypothetical protein